MSLRQLEKDLDTYTTRRDEVAAFRAGLSDAQLDEHDNRSDQELGEVNQELEENGKDMDVIDRNQLVQRKLDLIDFGRGGLRRIEAEILDINTEILRAKNLR
ncbi:hypothetical protein [Stenotrophomonas sp. 9(2022)]|uniref:hypothetical protein n=1 Tax=Stenotrophomonas sp. 9(2022) TaxID=2950153 RepID=UPI0021144051|nr:hypothetical protein [Stenotrophomonas sp. 9(2022)]